MKTSLALALTVGAALQLGATDSDGCGPGDVIRDPGFDVWCGDTLCTWHLVTGDIAKVPTWHGNDAGVAFLGDEAIIEQTSFVNHGDGTCLQFEMIADVEPTAEMTLAIDVFADGTIDATERIPTTSWKQVTLLLKLATPYNGIRFQLAKRGAGNATLAQIGARVVPATDCDGFTAIVTAPAPNGAWCADDAGCASGLCRNTDSIFHKTCIGCDAQNACSAGDVCGVGLPTSGVRDVPRECVPEAGDVLGDQCARDEECASGICAEGRCSSCDATRACASGTCRAAYPQGPLTCIAQPSGSACASAADCVSGECAGEPRSQCDDGRPCTSPASCPAAADDTLAPGECREVGIAGGTCT